MQATESDASYDMPIAAYQPVVTNVLRPLEHAGEDAFAVWQLFAHLLFGWPGYLIANYTGARRLHDKSFAAARG